MAPDRQYCVETKGSKSPYSYSSILESLRPNLAEKKKKKKRKNNCDIFPSNDSKYTKRVDAAPVNYGQKIVASEEVEVDVS